MINTRNKPRNIPHFTGLEFTETGSVLSSVVLDFETTQENIRQGKYLLDSELISTLDWADIIFVCGEMYYLALLVRDKPVIGIPVGFEFENFTNTSKEHEVVFQRALTSCAGYIMRDDFTSFARQHFRINGLEERRFQYPSVAVPFALANTLMEATNNLSPMFGGRYIFYATRITRERFDIDSADNKGSERFFQSVLYALPYLKANNIKLLAIKRDKISQRFIDEVSPLFGDILITVPEQTYPEFLRLAAGAFLVVDSFGAGGVPHGTTSDSLAVGTPVLSSFNFSQSERQSLADLGLHEVVFDAAFDTGLSQDEGLLRAIKTAFLNGRPVDKELKWGIERSDRFISDKQFSKMLATYLNSLIESNS